MRRRSEILRGFPKPALRMRADGLREYDGSEWLAWQAVHGNDLDMRKGMAGYVSDALEMGRALTVAEREWLIFVLWKLVQTECVPTLSKGPNRNRELQFKRQASLIRAVATRKPSETVRDVIDRACKEACASFKTMEKMYYSLDFQATIPHIEQSPQHRQHD